MQLLLIKRGYFQFFPDFLSEKEHRLCAIFQKLYSNLKSKKFQLKVK